MTDKAMRGPGRPRSDQARDAILDAAFQLLEENGLERFTIEGVAARSGTAKTTIYRWWPGKGALAMEALLAHAELTVPTPSTASAVADLRTMLQGIARSFAGATGRVVASIVLAGQNDPATLKVYHEKVVEPRRQRLRDIIERGKSNGEFRGDLHVETLVEAMYGALYTRLLIRFSPLDEAGWMDRHITQLLEGALPRPLCDRKA
ncbi:TetR/AcrR family transcriptional regulator [Nitrospirillum pindoramense]|nr:TetR/AcrR family transcriptional regulator [Nitrospirillum amazonense]